MLAHPVAGEPPLPAHYHQARRGLTTFLFRLPLPPSSPPSIDFGNGLARIRYEVSASAAVAWKNQNRLVTSQCPVDVLQRYPGDDTVLSDDGLHNWPAPECLVIGEGGKIWAQARVLGGMLVAGESACVELQVKNHSAKKVRLLLPRPRSFALPSLFPYVRAFLHRRRVYTSHLAGTCICPRRPMIPAKRRRLHYRSRTPSQASHFVAPTTLRTRVPKALRGLYSTSRVPPVLFRHILGTVVT